MDNRLNIQQQRSDQEDEPTAVNGCIKCLKKCGPIGNYIIKRWFESNLLKWVTEPPKRDECDDLLNVIGLIAALLLTIPFSVTANFNQDFFDRLEAIMPTCKLHGTIVGDNMQGVRTSITATMAIALLGSVYSLIGTLMYYLFRPNEDGNPDGSRSTSGHPTFQGWWKRGKFFLLILITAIIISTFSIFWLLVITWITYTTSTSHFCDWYTNMGVVDGTVGVFWAFTAIGFYLIF